MKLFKTNSPMRQVVYWDSANETYKTYRTINERITHKGENPEKHILDVRKFVYLTSEQRRENAEYILIEKGIRPIWFTDQEWEWALNEIKEYEHIAKCEAKGAWMYEF